MSDVALSVVLKDDNLRIDERDVLNHVREWATVNSVRSLNNKKIFKNQ